MQVALTLLFSKALLPLPQPATERVSKGWKLRPRLGSSRTERASSNGVDADIASPKSATLPGTSRDWRSEAHASTTVESNVRGKDTKGRHHTCLPALPSFPSRLCPPSLFSPFPFRFLLPSSPALLLSAGCSFDPTTTTPRYPITFCRMCF